MYRVKIFKIFTFLFLLTFLSVSAAIAGPINKPAIPFTLKDIKGQEVSLSDFRGKVVFIDFWATWCPPCKKEFPELNAMLKAHAGDDLVVLAINEDKKEEHVGEFLGKIPGLSEKMVVLLDPGSKVIDSYKAMAMPTSFIIDKDGIVRYIHFGYSKKDPAKWVAEVGGLLK